MLRLTWSSTALPPRLLSEDEFSREFEPLAAGGFFGLPPGPVVVESLDPQRGLIWCAYYKSALGLGTLLRQLRDEREIRARNARAARR